MEALLLYLILLSPLGFAKSNAVIIFFFSPTCPYCVAQAPLVEELYEDGFKVIGISEVSDGALLNNFRRKTGLRFKLMKNSGEIEKAGIFSFPTLGVYFPRSRNPELYIISEGLIKSKKELVKRIVEAVKEMRYSKG